MRVMDNTIMVFSGRDFTKEDIDIIKWLGKTYPQLSRSELAATVCEVLEWTTPAGKVKIPQCLDLLVKLETEGVLQLPVLHKFKTGRQVKKRLELEFRTEEINGNVSEYEPIILKIVTPGPIMNRWREYIDRYHMLGDKMVFGSRLQYFVQSGDIELGCMQFSASSWALSERDTWIDWGVEDRKKRLHLIVNNSRFLIFPWIHIRNLASKALSLAAKQIQEDWLRVYCYAPVLLETFVDLEHFKGTCYKGSNWIYLGETKGRGRMDKNRDSNLSKKAIFMYPLQKDFKECLRGEKPYKVVNPDE